MKKRAFYLLLALAVLLCLVPGCSSQDMAGQCGANLRWTYSDKSGTLTITGSGPMYDYTYPQPWSSVLDRITVLSLPQGMTHIGSYAFYRCTHLTSVAIPTSVTSIGDHAFSDCTELTSVALPGSVVNMGRGVFEGCSKLIVPAQAVQATAAPVVQSVVTQAPEPTLAPYQPTDAPYGPAATQVPPGDRCGEDLTWSFSAATGLLTITGSGEMYDFDWQAQPWQSVRNQITAVSLPNGLTTIGRDAFRDCASLASVTVPEGVATIEREAFRGCGKLTTAALPRSLRTLGSYAFADCAGLTAITIPSGVFAIEDGTFSGCSALLTASLPQDLSNLGASAFRDCSSLTDIAIPKGVRTIPRMAFSGCTDLVNLSIPQGVTAIDEYAFYGCGDLETVSLPKSLKSVGWSAFDKCSSLATVYYAGKNEHRAQISFDGGNDDLEEARWRYSTVTGLSITREPVDAVARNGELASFAVRTSGQVNACQWYYRTSSKSKWVAIDSGTSAVLTFTAKPSQDGYQYVCEIENDYGVLTTNVVTLTMELYPPTILKEPKDVTVYGGETAVFTVMADDAEGYQWYYRSGPKGKWTKSSSGKQATHSFTVKYAYNGHQYYCEVRNDDGKVDSEIVTLTVIPRDLKITAQPTDVHVTSGEQAVFTVKAEGATSYQWYYRSGPKGKWNKSSSGKQATHTFTVKYAYNGHQYYCEVANGDVTLKTDVVDLIVAPLLPAITGQPADQTVNQGEKAVFTVTADHARSYQWYYRKSAKGDWSKVKSDGAKATLTVTAKSSHNGYQYRCTVKNDDGSVRSEIVTLTVK